MNSKNALVALLGAIASSGCVSARPIPLPGGAHGYVVDNCNKLSKCYMAAGKQCSNYEIISETAISNFLEPIYTVTFKCP